MIALPQDPWAIAASPTLRLAQRAAPGQPWVSLSTPTFTDRPLPAMELEGATRQLPADGGEALRRVALAELFAGWTAGQHGCLVGAGAKAVLHAIFRAVLRPGDAAIVVAPYWPTYLDLCRLAFADALPLATRLEDGFALPLARLEALLAEGRGRVRLVVLSSPNNPSGVAYPRGALQEAERLAAAAGAWLVLDESFAQLMLDPVTPAPEPARPGPSTFVVNSFSKSFHLQGLRLAACLTPQAALPAVVAVHQTVNGAVSSASAALLHELVRRRELHPAIEWRSGWELARRFLDETGLAYVPPQGTFYVFPRIPGLARVRARLEAAGVLVLDGRVFGAAYAEHLRLCFMKPEAELVWGLQALRTALQP
jgi:aspartate/methionine/tyrosine aminotransferase